MSYEQVDGAVPSTTSPSSSRTLNPEVVVTGSSTGSDNPLQHSPDMSPEGAVVNLARIMELKKKQAIASWVNTQYALCKNARSSIERQWYINLAFVNGRHYVNPIVVPGQGFRLTAPKSPPWRVKMVINKIRTAVRTEHSKMCQNKPVPTVMPSTGENEDFAAANVGEQLLKTEFATPEFNKVYRSWAWWGVVTGSGFLKMYWDGAAIDHLRSPVGVVPSMADGQPLRDSTGNAFESAEPIKGKIRVERVTPFHVYVPDLLTEDINDQPYVMHVLTRSPQYIENNYGFKPICDTKSSDTILDSAFFSAAQSEATLDSVLVKEVWIKPNAHKEFPRGGMVTVINDHVVQWVDRWPYPFDEFPFYHYQGIKTGGFYGDSIIVDLIPLNKEYNRTKSQMLEIKNTTGRPHLLYQEGSLNPKKISSEPGQAVGYRMGFEKPTILPATEVPATMGMELDRLTSDFDDISGQHEITRGNTPPQVTSGTAIAFLQEQDDGKLLDQISGVEHAIALVGRHYLKMVSKYWTTPRLVKVVGRDEAFEAHMWKGSDLKGNTDVQVQSGSALPTSKAAKQALITEFMQNGWIDPSSGLEILDFGGLQKVIDEALVDKKQAQRENLKMSKLNAEDIDSFIKPPVGLQVMQDASGQEIAHNPATGEPWAPTSPIPVNSWDNHEAHIQFHNMYRKTQEFELLSDSHKQAFEMHVQAHQMALQSQMQGQMGNLTGPAEQQAPQGPDPAMEEERAQQGFDNDQRRQEEKHQMDMMERDESATQKAAQARLREAKESQGLKDAKENAKQNPKQIS